jgi:uncharacterized protein with HEPN domain
MSSREWIFRLDDILNALERVEEYTKGLDFKKFEADQRTIDAVIRNLEVVGEAARHIPEVITVDYPSVPWRSLRDMRNILIHEYFGIHTEIIWETICQDLPDLRDQLQQIKKANNTSI